MSLPDSPLKPRKRVLLGVAVAALVTLLTVLCQLGRISSPDAWLYDRMSPLVKQRAEDSIVLVSIDEKSLREIGRWPWSRRTHAELIDRLTAIGVRGIGLNVLLSEPALFDPEGDALLARALNQNGKVVLPVLAEPAQLNSPAVELLPIPEFSASAAALGHADMAQDADGVARSAFLQAGLGSARWPSLALALYQLGDETSAGQPLPGQRNPELPEASPYAWVRDYRVLVPYVQPANGFQHVSYADVLDKRVPDSLLHGRWVLVGVTAIGMGNTVQVPGQSSALGINGLDYQANLLNMLLRHSAVSPMALPLQLALSIALVLTPLLLCGLPGLARIWRPILLAMLLTVVAAWLMLAQAHLWFPPFATLLVLGLGLLAWTYGRARRIFRQSQSDALTGLANRSRFDRVLDSEVREQQRSGQPLSLLLIDIDHFKQLNDSHGHSAGDAVLRELTRVLRSRARRPRDLVARLGGDEFAVLLPETSSQAAATIATTIHVDLANLGTREQGRQPVPPFTSSIGIHTTVHADEALDAAQLFERADAALYKAKQAGRNRSSAVDGLPETGP